MRIFICTAMPASRQQARGAPARPRAVLSRDKIGLHMHARAHMWLLMFVDLYGYIHLLECSRELVLDQEDLPAGGVGF